ncbi:MAG: sensor signal transduction histidine kinase [Clostridia bacterium]|jgi:two-component system sensor histidine kinase VicK|nr:sensor signal transduction histidine kinase [Clostridia bacterium]
MLKSIQWKLVIISFLLVWLAMSIVGVYVTKEIKEDQLESLTSTIIGRAGNLANRLKDDMIGAPNIQDTVTSWFFEQGNLISGVRVYQDAQLIVAEAGNMDMKGQSLVDLMFGEIIKEQHYIDMPNEVGNEYSRSIGVPIISTNYALVGIIYMNADLSEVQENIDRIENIVTYATLWSLAITILLGSLLARTITDPIKEVTSKAEKLAKGEFEQIIAVKSKDEVGQLTEMFNYLSSRLKTTLDEIENEKNKLDIILTSMTDGIIAVSRTGAIIHRNPAVSGILDIGEETLENKSFDEITNELQWEITCEELFTNSEKANNILSIDKKIIKTNVVLFGNEKNETIGAIIVLQDITEQERLDRMRKEFVANVSHELRTPLTTIKSYTETLLDGAMDNKEYTTNFLKVIDSESERMTRLVKDLLQLSKLDYDNMQWNMKQMDIYKVVSDCTYKMDISAKQKNQTLIFNGDIDIPVILGDKDRIEQVIINILSNAIKYTPDNGKIEVSITKEENNIVIKVADTGLGIPKEDLPRLFERFYRVDKARSRMLGGTGLGLSIAKQIVEAHKGNIKIQSEYGQGTQVFICLPAA